MTLGDAVTITIIYGSVFSEISSGCQEYRFLRLRLHTGILHFQPLPLPQLSDRKDLCKTLLSQQTDRTLRLKIKVVLIALSALLGYVQAQLF